ncbi:MAG: cytochrome c biogenesis protein CcsA [bacterium]|nr:cytochrome c biogenesis protein CcsA [bacterium]
MPRRRVVLLTTAVTLALALGATSFLPATVYSSWWFFTIMAAVGAGIVVAIIKGRLWRQPAVGLLHASLVVILVGGGLTRLTAERGAVTLEPGVPVANFLTDDGRVRPLPQPLVLDTFIIERYPGAEMPSGYRSIVKVGEMHLEVTLNSPASLGGYRFFQQGYGNGGVTVLGVSHDSAGTAVSYLGYLLFAVAAVWMVALRRGMFRRLWRVALGAFAMVLSLHASAASGVSAAMADSMALKQVTYGGRVAPLHTVAREFALKTTGSANPDGMNPVQFMLSVMVYPAEWGHVKFLKVKSAELRSRLGVNGKYVAPADLFDASGEYRLKSLYGGSAKGLDREVLDLDSKVELLMKLRDGTLFKPLAPGEAHRSEASVRLEVLYNTLSLWRWTAMAALAGALIVAAAMLFTRRRRGWWWLAAVIALVAALNFAARWIIFGSVPLSSGHEVMQFLLLVTAALTAVAGRRLPALVPVGLLMAGFAGLVSTLGASDPAITPLMPVLASPWLSIHVTLVMASYAVLLFTVPAAITALMRPSRRLTASMLLLCLGGVLLLGLGIFTGAMWANVSWGRYWAWDPKETWALVTLLIYAIPLHRTLGLTTKPRVLAIYLLIASLSIAMTYAGVNYLPSLHAYQS